MRVEQLHLVGLMSEFNRDGKAVRQGSDCLNAAIESTEAHNAVPVANIAVIQYEAIRRCVISKIVNLRIIAPWHTLHC